MPSFHFISLGCPKNRVDSEVVVAGLVDRGFEPRDEPQGADVIVINTCAFIQPAVEEAIDHLLQAAELKKSGETGWVVGLGCLPQRYGAELGEELAEIDLFVCSSALGGAAQSIAELIGGRRPGSFLTSADRFLYSSDSPRALTTGGGSAYVKIAEGCPNKCSYCTIPSIKGRQKSRPLEDILREVESLGRSGVREINLVAQDLTAYGRDLADRPSLSQLLKGLDRLEEAPEWIRLLYLNPGLVDDELLRFIAGSKRILPYLDIPLQHSVPRMIRAMNRRPPGEDTLAWIGHIRELIPEVVLRTSLMVGFPGETEADFEAMLEFVERAGFDHLGAFSFCPEEGTPAAGLPDQIPEEVALARLDRLLAIQKKVSRAGNEARVGSLVEVLVEGRHPESELLLTARSWFQAPEVDGVTIINEGQGTVGSLQIARIVEAHDFDLVAGLVKGDN